MRKEGRIRQQQQREAGQPGSQFNALDLGV
jgi:hypothetical protein